MDTKTRMVEAAFALFAEHGYDSTTVEMIVERAGVSRSTFFRTFGAKDDVIFPRHDYLLTRIDARLATGSAATWPLAVREAARLVLDHYLSEGEQARTRYLLTRSVSALRDRELSGQLGYQKLFRDHLRAWLPGDDAGLRAEVLAAAIVTAHNVVLRRWLRAEITDAHAEFECAMDLVITTAQPPTPARDGARAIAVVVVETDRAAHDVAALVRSALAEEATRSGAH